MNDSSKTQFDVKSGTIKRDSDANMQTINIQDVKPYEKAHMGLFSGIAMIVGLIIGSGIFATAGPAYNFTNSVGVTLIFWALAGVISAFGGLCYVELGCAIPKSGGEHNYLLKAFGPYMAYVFDWTQSFLSLPLATAAMALVFAQYLCKIVVISPNSAPNEQLLAVPEEFSHDFWIQRAVAWALILALGLINILSARLGSKISDVFTILKVGALVLIVVIGFWFLGKGNVDNFKNSFNNASTDPSSYGEALYQQLFAYSGWNNLNYMIDELKNPTRNLPLAIIISMSLVVSVYVLVNIAYFAVLPISIISKSEVIGTDVGYAAFGYAGAVLITVMVVFSAIGATNANLFSNSRLIAASSQDGILLPKVLSKDGRFNTPFWSLVLTTFLSCIFTIVPDTTTLFNVFSFITCIFTFLAVVGLLVLRRTCPDMHRPFRVYTPIAVIFCVVSLGLIVYPLAGAKSFSDVLPYLCSIFVMLLPIPRIYYSLRRQKINNGAK